MHIQAGRETNEAYKDNKRNSPQGRTQKRRVRGMPDIVPVRLQDFMYGCEPEVRTKIRLEKGRQSMKKVKRDGLFTFFIWKINV